MSKTLDVIQNRYKFEYKPDESLDYEVARDIYHFLFGYLITSYNKYNFDERLKKLSDILKRKETKIREEEFIFYNNKINEFITQTKNIREKFLDEYHNYSFLFYKFKMNYDANQNVPETLDICKNILKDLLNKISKSCINYEKEFLSINDLIVDINNKLINLY